MIRKGILEQAITCICNDRQNTHGAPENTFKVIAKMWEEYLVAQGIDIELHPHDVAWMMVLFKVARATSNPLHKDNAIDAAGYAALAAELACSGE